MTVEGDWEWGNMLRMRAWCAIFAVAVGAANANSMRELRVRLIDALEAVDKAIEAGQA